MGPRVTSFCRSLRRSAMQEVACAVGSWARTAPLGWPVLPEGPGQMAGIGFLGRPGEPAWRIGRIRPQLCAPSTPLPDPSKQTRRRSPLHSFRFCSTCAATFELNRRIFDSASLK